MEKKTYFLAVYEEDGVFCGDFADFECVVDEGDTLEELIYNAKEILAFIVKYMVEKGQQLPEASDVKSFKAKLEKEPLCIVPVTVYPPAKTERINITAAGDLLEEITDYAKAHKLSRSELMVRVTLNHIRSQA